MYTYTVKKVRIKRRVWQLLLYRLPVVTIPLDRPVLFHTHTVHVGQKEAARIAKDMLELYKIKEGV